MHSCQHFFFTSSIYEKTKKNGHIDIVGDKKKYICREYLKDTPDNEQETNTYDT